MRHESEISAVGKYIQGKLNGLPEDHPDQAFLRGLSGAVTSYQNDQDQTGQGGTVVYESPAVPSSNERLATRINMVGQTLPDSATVEDLVDYNHTRDGNTPYQYPQWQALLNQLDSKTERSRIIRPLMSLLAWNDKNPEAQFPTVGDVRRATLHRLKEVKNLGPTSAAFLQKSLSIPKR
jgi:hypothetical protein